MHCSTGNVRHVPQVCPTDESFPASVIVKSAHISGLLHLLPVTQGTLLLIAVKLVVCGFVNSRVVEVSHGITAQSK